MPAGQGKDAERFAAAVESGTPLGAAGDDDLARDLEIVAMLRSRSAEFAPDPEVKARAKQRLMAVLAAESGGPGPAEQPRPQREVAPPAAAERTAPLGRLGEPPHRDVDPRAETARMAPVTARQDLAADEDDDDDTEATTATHSPPARPGRRARHSVANRPAGRARSGKRPAATGLRRRALLVGSAAMVMMLAIAGGGIFASQDALPGDSLYAVKRAAESAGLALTFDDAGKARRQLEIAATRLSEVERLSALEPQAAPAPEVFTKAMDEFDVAADAGSQLLLESAQPEAERSAASDLHTWASEQSERLTEIQPELPAAAEADESIELLDRLLGRTSSADEDSSCDDADCASREGDATTSESEEADATEDTEDTTTTPDESDSTDASETDEPSRTPTETSERDRPGLLPDLTQDTGRDNEDSETTSSPSEDEDSTTTSESESESSDEGDGNVSVPLPLLPPVTLPPLLPGMPGITIG